MSTDEAHCWTAAESRDIIISNDFVSLKIIISLGIIRDNFEKKMKYCGDVKNEILPGMFSVIIRSWAIEGKKF